MKTFENYKTRIIEKAPNDVILNEIGYCYKRACTDMFDFESYWVKCYYFLKGLAHYRNITPWC
jgi:hypothetical protein